MNFLWAVAVIVVVLWLLGFSFHIGGAFIHLLLIVALIAVVVRLVAGRRASS